ncbi:MAG: excinuclease ABC subunit UvrA [Candidatus Cloacimonetes bacterium]|nr:excinuclease ABC subunit UvrA [Candidatus Cloacimonadota bacterium]
MKKNIIIKGAHEHNLKHIDIVLPRNKFIVFSGVSGSGKSSLAFDTLYAEGQRRYVESLSSYARQFLGQMEKPKLDYIEGLSPAISIEQKAASKNPRSTVGTVTEIYDYLRVLYARIGEQHCYNCGDLVGSQTVDQIIQSILENPPGTKLQILAPVVNNRKGEHKDEIEEARNNGFVRIKINGIIHKLSEDIRLDKKSKHSIDVVVDRLVIEEGIKSRLTDSVETALKLTDGAVKVDYVDINEEVLLTESNSCARCGIGYPELSPQHFSFNSPLGMCPACNGLGNRVEFDPDKIVPHPHLSIMQGACIHWGVLNKKRSSWTLRILKAVAEDFDFSLTTPWQDYPEKIKNILLYGGKKKKFLVKWETASGSKGELNITFEGVIPTLKRRFSETASEAARRYYMQYISDKPCDICKGKKLRPESLAVLINGLNIDQVTGMSISECRNFFENIKLEGNRKIIASEVLKEIKNRLSFLENVGLHYLTLKRSAPTLSGGESQRIRLASQIGSSLVGVMYILDEPSIGLHQRDNHKLLKMLLHLRDIGNTVIVVEHDEDIILSADQIVDFGPHAGVLGGEVIFQGTVKQIQTSPTSLTGKYLSRRLEIPLPACYLQPDQRKLTVIGATQNNLKNITVDIPVGLLTCITGVSGSGKSSLLNQIIYPAVANSLHRSTRTTGKYEEILGIDHFDKVINIDQQPIGRTPRSNPATYINLFDPIRKLFAGLPASQIRGYKLGRFSFNVKGGRCEACQGAGVKQIEMHFLPDIFVTCEVCGGKRYNKETLAVRYKGYNISEILDLDVQQALEVFDKIPTISRKLKTLMDVGLDYIKLGQASTTLSGGEAQRIKLARELSKTSTGSTLYILDEPTTGLHFDDINKLLKVLHRLVSMGNTILVIEHNLDVIKCADYIIDLGPEGGDAGGYIIAQGSPAEISENAASVTGQFLKSHLKKNN